MYAFFQTIIMESYDQILIGSFFALPAFQKTFGFQTSDGSYQVSAPWQSALSKDFFGFYLALRCY